jgi:hypothetical protein
MSITEGVVYCDGCGAEVVGVPVVQEGSTFCCLLCAEGGECRCGEEEDDRRAPAAPAA